MTNQTARDDIESRREIEAKLGEGARLTRADGVRLFEIDDLVWLGRLADTVRAKRHGDRVTFAHGRDVAHPDGVPAVATVAVHQAEPATERVDRLLRVRDQQDGALVAVAPLRPEHPDGPAAMAHAAESLRTFAVARLLLDEFDHIQCYWPSHGLDVAGLALNFGVSDLTGSPSRYRTTHDTALVDGGPTEDDVLELIRDAGFTPVQRGADFTVVRAFAPPVPAADRRAEPQKVWT